MSAAPRTAPAPLAPVSAPAVKETRHTPERSCVACRRKRPQSELLRLVHAGEGWAMGSAGRSGRGAYVCADNPACWSDKKLRRAFGAQASTLSAQLSSLSPNPTQT